MELSVLLVPILLGYWVLIRTRILQPRIFRLSGYHVFFHAGLAGIGLLISAWASWLGMLLIPGVQEWWSRVFFFEHFEIIAISGVIAVSLPPIVNLMTERWISQYEWDKKQAREYGNLINLVIHEAWEAGSLVEISAKSGKSYIGLPQKSEIRMADQADVMLVPFMSGYREPKTRELVVTTEYWPVVQKCLASDGPLAHLSPEDFTIVLPQLEIASVRRFDLRAYNEFSKVSSQS